MHSSRVAPTYLVAARVNLEISASPGELLINVSLGKHDTLMWAKSSDLFVHHSLLN